ncbi:hypothetical protein C2S52_021599 [Perilla frutescens var. hirtella]|nr:hypothetical protein C2S52_021599 [Perilla frutescens var. hirtella]
MDSTGSNSSSDILETRIVVSLGLSEYYIPGCESSMKPLVGMMFKNLSDGIEFYKVYAARCGFDIRLGTAKKYKDGTITLRYVYCNKQGSKNSAKEYDDVSGHVMKKRRRVSRRMDCMARISFKFKGEHGVNVGPMRCYKLFKQVVGAYSNVGCTSSDVKNFTRDLRAYIDGADAQMILDNLFRKRELCPAFFFDYCVNADDQLTCLMWADPICRRNFALFGDIVSFDASYSTNRYEMIFTPFTGKDNHGKCVTFGAALLSSEDNEAYSWVLDNFKVCMGRSPAMLITDQDPGLKITVQRSLSETRHPLCMWHIMLKVLDKVPAHLRKNELFREKFNNIVWSDFIEPVEFEKKWEKIMVEFGLTETSWFSSIALDSQRHTYAEMNSLDESFVPELRTPILLEKHAATVYTTSIFHKVQKEIYAACFKCRLMSIVHDERQLVYEVNDGCYGIFQVRYDRDENTVVCSCAKFVRKGLLCCHIFIILKDLSFDRIPDKYMLSRWRRTSYFDAGNGGSGDLVNHCAGLEDNKVMINTCISEFYACITLVEGDKERTSELLRGVRDLKIIIGQNDDMENSDDKDKLFSDFYGSAPPSKIDVLPPKFVKMKGSESRLKPREEKQVERANKPLRTCRKCKKKCHHDARN